MDSTPVDMNQMAVLVGQHEKQQQIVEQQWQSMHNKPKNIHFDHFSVEH